jgi:hypothetical protein
MTEDQITKREEELREQYPHMFSHPELRAGEIYYAEQPVDFAIFNVQLHQNAGLRSARLGEGFLKDFQSLGEITHHPFFANLREYLECEIRHQESTSQAR